ncbi:MAG TPA: beta-ketoacyl synthase N-terminal-like domain-containing protein [Chryseolinea sp.]|nr:beta-ketoacyl synthase N-terminal-like domain-containing protein [Chryseolinea sp.]
MNSVWIAADSIVSPLGSTSRENYEKLRAGNSALRNTDDMRLSPTPFIAGKIPGLNTIPGMTILESITCQAIEEAIQSLELPLARTIFILSSTKGNISFLEEGNSKHPRLHLHALAEFIASKFGFKSHLVVSNACISGVMALIVGKRMIESGKADHVVVAGADVLSRFVVSGFQSLQALSDEPCRPFDAERKGINLGEGAAAIVLTGKPGELGSDPAVKILGGGLSNDANHISGPSRSGEELGYAIRQALVEADVKQNEIDFISAHGTATLYNDEMEAKAFNIHQLAAVPTHSLKGYFGHTLGAAGVLEVAMCVASLLQNELLPSKGFQRLGVSQPLSVIERLERRELRTCLKTASGFGGCNAAIILRKEN